MSTAQELQIMIQVKGILNKNFQSPGDEFTRYFVKCLNDGKSPSKLIEQYKPIIKKSIASVINDIIQDRLNFASKNTEQQTEGILNQVATIGEQDDDKLQDGIIALDKESGVVTTQEEIDAYNIIRSILRKHISADKIVYKDFKSYFAIGIENSSYWWICRLSFGSRKKLIWFPTEGYKSQEKIELESIDDIFNCIGKLEQALDIANNAYEAYKSKHEK